MPSLERQHAESAHEVRCAGARRAARQAARPARRRSRPPPQGPARGAVASACATIVDRLDLRRALVDENTLAKLKVAGFRGQNPLTRFLFFRLVLPFVVLRARRRLSLPARRSARTAALHQALRLHRRRLCRLLRADALRQQPRHQAQAVDPAGLAGCARPDADLRRIRHVGRSRHRARSPTRSARSRSRWPRSSC